MPIIETRAISLQAPQDVKLRAGLTLPAGLYPGTEERIRADSIGGPSPDAIAAMTKLVCSLGATPCPLWGGKAEIARTCGNVRF
jgi:hypothetical protein